MGNRSNSLLVQGNSKLSAGIFHFSIPPVITCPGRTALCERHCYARSGRFAFGGVSERLKWNRQQALRDDFVDRAVAEIYRRGVMVLRVHVSGDFFSPDYARKWYEIARQSPQARLFSYTRSYRVPLIADVFEEMATLPNVRLWYSADAEAFPEKVPPNVRIAWMQTKPGDERDDVDLVFRVRSLRKASSPSAKVLCPQETPEGKERGTTCATCRFCWQ